MFDVQLIVCNDHLFVVGYIIANRYYGKHLYKLPVTLMTDSSDQQRCASTKWIELTQTTHLGSSLVSGLSSLVVVGGLDELYTAAADMIYDRSTVKWKEIDSLSFARSRAAATTINDNALIVIGGCTSTTEASLTVV